MIELLLAAQLSCADGYWILDGIENAEVSQSMKSDLKITVIESMPEDCKRSDHETRSRNR